MAKAARQTPKQPDFHAYVVSKKDGQDKGYWTKIGAAWRHEDGEGYNLTLVAFPVGGEIVLRIPKAQAED